jgi:hypothetical protein
VRQRRHRPRLAREALERLGVGGELLRQDLDRHLAAEAGVARPPDLAHAAGAERADDLVAAEARARRQPPGRARRHAGHPPGLRADRLAEGGVGVVRAQQRLDLRAQRAVAAAGAVEERFALTAR